MKNIGELMKKAQQVQTQVNILQTKLAHQEFTGSAGNGLVTVTITGKSDATKVHIDPAAVQDVETLEDLVLVAINNARELSDKYQLAEMERIQNSLGLPPDFKMPF